MCHVCHVALSFYDNVLHGRLTVLADTHSGVCFTFAGPIQAVTARPSINPPPPPPHHTNAEWCYVIRERWMAKLFLIVVVVVVLIVVWRRCWVAKRCQR